MTKLSLIWSLIGAVFVGGAALTTGYIYMDRNQKTAEAPDPTADKQIEQAATESSSEPSGTGPVAADAGSDQPETEVVIIEEQLTFDVVGVEPTGETVVAGRSDAGSIVALTANGKVVGKGIANEKGEWTIILEKPLEPGDYDVGLQTQDEAGEKTHESTQRLAVSVPEDRESQPLVVLNKPDAPSNVLQMPAPAAASAPEPEAEETVVAAAPSTAEPAAPAEPQTAPAEQATAPAEPKQEPAPETQVAAAPAEPAPAEVQTQTTAEPVAPAAADTPAEAPAETETAAAPAPAETTETVAAAAELAATPAEQPAEQPQATAQAADTKTQAEEPAATEVAAAPAPVEAAPEAKAETETAEASVPVPAAKQPAEKAAETEVAAVAPTAKPKAPETAPAATPTVTATASGAEPEAKPAAPKPVVSVEAVESERGKLYVAGTGTKGQVVRIYVGDEYVGDVRVGSNGRWLLQAPKDLKPGTIDIRADLVGDQQGTVLARAAVAFEKAEEQIVLTKVVASGETATDSGTAAGSVVQALPNVIIRKGDNLWTISRRLYGQGVRYTTIYQANKGQIRNPDLIYPGQVFLTPQGDLNWKPETN